jgi:hypothetical protein
MESVAKIAHMVAARVLAAGGTPLQEVAMSGLLTRAVNYSARPEAFAMATH